MGPSWDAIPYPADSPHALARAAEHAAAYGELDRFAAWLAAHAAADQRDPWLAWCAARSGRADEAVSAYERWLEDAEAPAAVHLAQLCRLYQRAGDATACFRTAARFHPWDLAFEPRRVAAVALDKVEGSPSGFRPYRITLLPTSNLAPVLPCLRVGAARLGLNAALHAIEMGALGAEIADPSSSLYASDPDVVVIATTWRDLRADRAADTQADEWMANWTPILDRTRATILQHTFDRPAHEPSGGLAARDPRSLRRIAARVNERLAERAPDRVVLVDYDQEVSRFGADRWTDARQWFWAKEAVSSAAAPYLTEGWVGALRAVVGQAAKVLVLDLDHTVWGGVVGEDGVDALKIGPPSLEGEAHLALQHYVRALKDRGVLLAVCSKNNPDDAREPFLRLRDMALGLDDFVAFEASWDDKPVALRRMADRLQLGLDAFVFLDDNPAERALMRRLCPEVVTVPLLAPPADLVSALDRARLFEVTAVSREDLDRTAQYRQEGERSTLERSTGSLEDYYRALEMIAEVRPFDDADLTRIVQLAARSNQFNLTTWRLTPAEVRELARSPTHATLTVRLRDRFGDYGLVAEVVARVDGDRLEILHWCMSCRVLKRSVEELVDAEIDRIAIEAGCAWVIGRRIATAKNQLVAELFPTLGYELVSTQGDTTLWRRPVDPTAPRRNPHARVERVSVGTHATDAAGAAGLP